MSVSLPIRAGGADRAGDAGVEGVIGGSTGGENTAVAAGAAGGVKNPNDLLLIIPSSHDLKIAMGYNKLRGQSNYVYWSDRSKSALEYLDLWDYVTGEIAKPPISNAIQREIWSKNDKRAHLLISNRIEEIVHSRVRTCTTSSDLWEKLENMFKLNGVSGKQAAWENWERVQLKEQGDVMTYLSDHDNARSLVEELGTQVDNEYAALRLLIGLPTSWGVFRATVETGAADRNETLDYDKIYRLISQEDNRRKGIAPSPRNLTLSPTPTKRWHCQPKLNRQTNRDSTAITVVEMVMRGRSVGS